MKLAAVLAFVVLLLPLVSSALAGLDDVVLALTDGSKVILVDAAQMAAIERRAKAGEAAAQFVLGCAYRDGGPILAQNQAEAVQWFRKAAEQGFPEGEHALGGVYLEGRGVAQNDAEAARWYTKAAQHGNAAAMASLGFLYYVGRGGGAATLMPWSCFQKPPIRGSRPLNMAWD